jgi:hypothetical protein
LTAIPYWAGDARRLLVEKLAEMRIRDSFQVMLRPRERNSLAWYWRYTQFSPRGALFCISETFADDVMKDWGVWAGLGRRLTSHDLTRSALWVLAHEYGHVMVEFVGATVLLARLGNIPSVSDATLKLWSLLKGWRSGPGGREEAFPDDFAVHACGVDMFFWDERAVALREAMRPRVKEVVGLYADFLDQEAKHRLAAYKSRFFVDGKLRRWLLGLNLSHRPAYLEAEVRSSPPTPTKGTVPRRVSQAATHGPKSGPKSEPRREPSAQARERLQRRPPPRTGYRME